MVPRFELLVAAGGRDELLRGAVALGPEAGGRPLIGAVSAAAEAAAVKPGMSLGEAFARCPQLKLVSPDPAAAAEAWQVTVARIEAIGAAVEWTEVGTAYFEAAGLERMHGGLEGILRAVRKAVERSVRLGVAPTRFCAFMAARMARPRRSRLVLAAHERRNFLGGLAVNSLSDFDTRFAGLAVTLQRLGIETLAELGALPEAKVAERFGKDGLAARDLVFGREQPLRPHKPVEHVQELIALEGSPVAGQLMRALELLIERVLARPERKQRTLRALVLAADFVEGGSWRERVVLREPTADAERIRLALERKLELLPEPAAELSLTVEAFGPAAHSGGSLFGKKSQRERASRLEQAIGQARRVAGSTGVARIVTLDRNSRLPERRVTLAPGPAPLAKPRPVALRCDATGRPVSVCPLRRRGPARAGKGGGTRRRAYLPVAGERERWLVEDRWWTGSPVRRQYFELVLADGSDVVVFHDLVSDGWFEQRA